MMDPQPGSQLWKNLEAVKIGEDGGIEVPLRANGRDGIVLGVDAVARAEASSDSAERVRKDPPRGWRQRFRRHRG